ncbi:hypothetical protein BHE74_00056406 [Ensete ventricosum]|nr:hypothetical protein BHE74_00056406 [Ensete ventricosum]
MPPHRHPPPLHVAVALSLRRPPLFLSSLLLSPAPATTVAPNAEAPAASSCRLSLSSPRPPAAASSPLSAVAVFRISPLLPLIKHRPTLGSSRPTLATVATAFLLYRRRPSLLSPVAPHRLEQPQPPLVGPRCLPDPAAPASSSSTLARIRSPCTTALPFLPYHPYLLPPTLQHSLPFAVAISFRSTASIFTLSSLASISCRHL